MPKAHAPLLEWAFNDVLNELHQLVFADVPGDSGAFDSISQSVADDRRLRGIIRNIDGVVISIKAATSKSRSDPTSVGHLNSRGIEDV